jgi:hypothetical protein
VYQITHQLRLCREKPESVLAYAAWVRMIHDIDPSAFVGPDRKNVPAVKIKIAVVIARNQYATFPLPRKVQQKL